MWYAGTCGINGHIDVCDKATNNWFLVWSLKSKSTQPGGIRQDAGTTKQRWQKRHR